MPETKPERIKNFAKRLVDNELTDETEIKLEMEALGLVYCKDEIKRLNQVLLALHPLSEKTQTQFENQLNTQEASH